MKVNTVITGTGCHVPEFIKTNNDFINQDFYTEENQRISRHYWHSRTTLYQ